MADTETQPDPPAGPRPRALVAGALVALAALWAGVAFSDAIRAGAERVAGLWSPAPAATTKPAAGPQYYQGPMHPWIIMPEPGQCPICGMDLVPIDPEKLSGEVTIDPVVVQKMGVRLGEVTTGPLTRTIRTVGDVAYAEPRVRDVNLKVSGWIEKLHVDKAGATIEKGEPLFTIYSPKLFSAQEEYLLALRGRGAATRPGEASIVRSARTRLRYFDITAEQIEALERRGRPAKTMTIRSPHGGTVVEKHVKEGMHVTPGTRLYRIADLSRVWVMATIYEYQLPYLEEGQEATMSLPYIPGQSFRGKVDHVYPYMRSRTREARARLVFPNPKGLLKPGMFANVRIHSTLAEDRVLAPRAAVMDTGKRQVALVYRGEGRFEPRDLETGITTDSGKVEILDGLEPGERVVTSGQFLIDSEAKMRESLAKMVRGAQAGARARPARRDEEGPALEALPEEAAAALADALEATFRIGRRLARDNASGLERNAERIAEALGRLTDTRIPGAPRFWHEHDGADRARRVARELARAKGLEAARPLFADLSIALAGVLEATGAPRSVGPVEKLHCPMFREGQGGAVWIQPRGEVRNPFLGSEMPGCFDERRTLPSAAAATRPAATRPAAPDHHAHH